MLISCAKDIKAVKFLGRLAYHADIECNAAVDPAFNKLVKKSNESIVILIQAWSSAWLDEETQCLKLEQK